MVAMIWVWKVLEMSETSHPYHSCHVSDGKPSRRLTRTNESVSRNVLGKTTSYASQIKKNKDSKTTKEIALARIVELITIEP